MIQSNEKDLFVKRKNDWRIGHIVYEVFLDRFSQPENVEKKKYLYPSPKKLHTSWNDKPKKGQYLEKYSVWSHETEFWGGDFASFKKKLSYLKELGIEVIYFHPIFHAFTNHKYDTIDYIKIDPAYGTHEELVELIKVLHKKGMRVILDGVFNHMGDKSPLFIDALKNKQSTYRDFFKFTQDNTYIGWSNAKSLPELNLLHESVQKYIFLDQNSILQSYLRNENIDGWRLDVAHDIGFSTLKKITLAAHSAKSDSITIGETYNYPEKWLTVVDGIINMHARQLILALIEGKISGPIALDMWEEMIHDAGIENILKSWIVLDNYDTQRLSSILKKPFQIKLAQVLQLTLPGSPCIYYGSEVGMKGAEDPAQRAPMRWDLVKNTNSIYTLFKRLIHIRKSEPALRYGNFRKLTSKTSFAFMRTTDSIHECILIIMNPTNKKIQEFIQIPESKIQDYTELNDLLSKKSFIVHAGTLELGIPPYEVFILKPNIVIPANGYSRYDQIIE